MRSFKSAHDKGLIKRASIQLQVPPVSPTGGPIRIKDDDMRYLKVVLALAAGVFGTAFSASSAVARDFTLESFFKGRTYAYGWFGAINGSERRFRVVLDGRWNGKVLTLRERFEYTDGEKDVKTWVFTKTGPNTYSGMREDVIGSTVVTLDGARATFAYDVDLTPKASPTIVHFNDTLELQPDGTVLNTAWVTRWHIPVARVKVNFARTEAKALAIRP
jgi:hypothetical protein